MLRGKVSYYDTEINSQVDYEVWGYSLQQSLKLVLRPLTDTSINYFTLDTEHKMEQFFSKNERGIEIYPTKTVVDTKLNEETIKAYTTTRTLPALMGMAYNLLVRMGEQTSIDVNKQMDSEGNISYGLNMKYVKFDPKANEPSSVLRSGISYPRREGAFNVNAFYFEIDTFKFELEKTNEKDSQKLPYAEAKYTVSFRMDSVLKNLGFVEDSVEELNFDDGVERGMFLESLDEVIERYPNKSLEWIKHRDYHMVNDDNLEETIKYLYTFPHLAVDTETTGLRITFRSKSFKLEPFSDQLVGIIISGKEGEAFFFPVRMNSIPNLCKGDHPRFMERYMKPLLEKIPIILFNAAFDAKVFMIYDIFINLLMDVMVALQDTLGYKKGIKQISLKNMTNTLLNRDAIEISELTRTGSYDDANFADVPENLVLAYACPDSDNTLGLYNYIIDNHILEDHNAMKLVKLDSHFALCIAYQEFYGQHIKVDSIPNLREDLFKSLEDNKNIMLDCMKEVSKELVSKGLDAISEIDNFNPNSTQQMLKIAYQDFKMPLQKKYDKNTRRFKPTLDKGARKTLLQVLKSGSLARKFIKAFQEYSDSNTMVKNFTKNLNSMMSEDGYTFSKVNQFLMTGRLATAEPPYQNYSKSIKPYIVPRPGFGMSDNDYQSIEYKIIAGLSGEPRLLKAFQDPNTDYHRLQASNMFDLDYALITDDLRQEAKGFNFGIPFGMGAESLGEHLRGERSPENTAYAEKMLVKYFVGQDNVKAFFDNRRAWAVRDGYSETVMNRRRYYDKRTTSVGAIRRQAGNQPIQGSAADFFKLAVIRLYYSILKNNWQGKILLSGFIHDEMLIEVHQSIHPLDYLKFLLNQVELRVDGFPPMFIGWGYGANWYQAKTVDVPTQLQYELISHGSDVEYPNWDGDNDKFYYWLEDRKFVFFLKELRLYLSNPENEETTVTPVALGYLKTALSSEFNASKCAKQVLTDSPEMSNEEVESIVETKHLEFDLRRQKMFLNIIGLDETEQEFHLDNFIKTREKLKEIKVKELSMYEQFDLVLPILALDSRVNILDPSLNVKSNEITEEIQGNVVTDIDSDEYYEAYSNSNQSNEEELTYEERVALREIKYKQKQMFERLNTFGNSPDLENSRIIFKKDATVLNLVMQYSKDSKLDDSHYIISVYDDSKNLILNTPKYISINDVRNLIELVYYQKIGSKNIKEV